MDYSEGDLELFRKIAEGEALGSSVPKDRARLLYKSLYKHPLDNIEARYHHEKLLQRLLTIPLEKQVFAAITLGDPWCLEELYLRGATVQVVDRCGVTPLHLAARLDKFDCCMVLVNIGVNINSAQLDGMTPLGLAIASGSTRTASYLREVGGLATVPKQSTRYTAASTVLEHDAFTSPSDVSRVVAKANSLPHHHTFY